MRTSITSPAQRHAPGHGQRGIVLIVALIVLVAMSMAGVLMLRSLGTGLGIAGNVAFKEGATMAADRGVETARAWVLNTANVTDTTDLAVRPGYYATWNGGVTTPGAEFDPLTYDWATANGAVALASEQGNTVQYVIHRLCQAEGATTVAGQQCVVSQSQAAFTDLGGSKTGGSTRPSVPHYRVTARVAGPRDTFSFVQVVLY